MRTMTIDGLGANLGNPWGDWLNVSETTPIEYIDTCYHAHACQLMAEMADALRRPVEAEVVARTANHEFGKPDFAVLKLQQGQLPPLALSPAADRLLPVVAVGFPGFVTQVGDDFQRLLKGEEGAMPAAHFMPAMMSLS